MPSRIKENLAEPLVVSVAEARRLLGVSNTAFYGRVLPELETFKIGRARRIPLAAIYKYIAHKLAANTPGKRGRGRPRKLPAQTQQAEVAAET
jgi:hypothetical protein